MKMKRHVASIEGIRDRTIHITAKLMASIFAISETTDGIKLDISNAENHLYSVDWTAVPQGVSKQSILSYFNTETISRGYSVTSTTLQVTFPCILIRANFDPFTIIRAPHTYTAVDIFHQTSEADASIHVPLYCAEEIWELCHSSGHNPGEALPLLNTDSFDASPVDSPNMVLPMAHTRLLFAVYKEKGRNYQSAINVTGDCMALTPVSFQWGKFFHDSLIQIDKPLSAELKFIWISHGIKALSSFSMALKKNVAAWAAGMTFVTELFEEVPDKAVVISRDNLSGITCPLGFASLASLPKSTQSISVYSWNLLVSTIFSRMCESISGTKNIRAPNATRSLGELEDSYRLLLGRLQSTLRRRFYVEWAKSSLAEKQNLVGESSRQILAELQSIVTGYLSRFPEFGMLSWNQIIRLLLKVITIRNYGIERILDSLEKFDHVDEVVHDLLAQCDSQETFILPVIQEDEAGRIFIRELEHTDLRQIVTFIDSIIATNASPKVVYAATPTPSLPSMSTSANRELNCSITIDRWNQELPVANISFVGNVNSGKSSICGKLLSSFGLVTSQRLDKLGHEAKKLGYSTDLKHAWIMDKTKEERSSGVTIHPTWVGFQTTYRRLVMIDNPGHKDYARNSTYGIFHADIVVLVTSAVMSEVELGNLAKGQGLDHLITAYCFGIRKIIVAVNKMDLVEYSQEAFDQIRQLTMKTVKKAGFKEDQVVFVPISVLDEQCLVAPSSLMPWYSGPPLIQLIDETQIPRRQPEKPLRLVVSETRKVPGVGAVVCGKVESGVVSVGDRVLFSSKVPIERKVISIQAHSSISLQRAIAGDDVGIALGGSSAIVSGGASSSTSMSASAGGGSGSARNRHIASAKPKKIELKKGLIMYPVGFPPLNIKRFEAQLLLSKLFFLFYLCLLLFHDCCFTLLRSWQ